MEALAYIGIGVACMLLGIQSIKLSKPSHNTFIHVLISTFSFANIIATHVLFTIGICVWIIGE